MEFWVRIIAKLRATNISEPYRFELAEHVLVIPHPQMRAASKQQFENAGRAPLLLIHSQVRLAHEPAGRLAIRRIDIALREPFEVRLHGAERTARHQVGI